MRLAPFMMATVPISIFGCERELIMILTAMVFPYANERSIALLSAEGHSKSRHLRTVSQPCIAIDKILATS